MYPEDKYRSSIECLICYKFPIFLKNVAWKLSLEITIKVDKFLLKENIRYEVIGGEYAIKEFRKIVYTAINEFNNK